MEIIGLITVNTPRSKIKLFATHLIAYYLKLPIANIYVNGFQGYNFNHSQRYLNEMGLRKYVKICYELSLEV